MCIYTKIARFNDKNKKNDTNLNEKVKNSCMVLFFLLLLPDNIYCVTTSARQPLRRGHLN